MPYSYIDIVVEARWNPTESREIIEDILTRFIPGKPVLDERFDSKYLVIHSDDIDDLQIFHDWVIESRFLDTVRLRLIKSIVGNITAVYFNRQAAAMHRLALVDVDDNPPLGPITLQIISDDLMDIINQITPRTHEGKILTEAEWNRLQIKLERKKEQKKKDKEKKKRTKIKF